MNILQVLYLVTVLFLILRPLFLLYYSNSQSCAVPLYWILFSGYYIFVLIAIVAENNYFYSTFGGSSYLTPSVKLIGLIYIVLFLIFFRLNIPRFTPVDSGKFLPSIAFIILILITPAYYLQDSYLKNTVEQGGYYSLYLSSSSNYLLNFLTKYLPLILILLFFATNKSKKFHYLFLIPLILSNLPILLTGQRTGFVLSAFLWMTVYLDVFVKSRSQLFIPIISFIIFILLIAFAGLMLRGGDLHDIFKISQGFSKPALQLFSSISAMSTDFNINLGFLELFPVYSYFCDYGSLVESRNVCTPLDRLFYPGVLEDLISFVDDPIMYHDGGTSGSGFIGSLSRVGFIGFTGVVSKLVAFIITCWAMVVSINFIFRGLCCTKDSLYIQIVLKICFLFLFWMILFSISGTVSSLIIGSRTLIYLLITIPFLLMLNKLYYSSRN